MYNVYIKGKKCLPYVHIYVGTNTLPTGTWERVYKWIGKNKLPLVIYELEKQFKKHTNMKSEWIKKIKIIKNPP